MTDSAALLTMLARSVVDGDDSRAAELSGAALHAGVPALEVVERGLVPGIEEAGRLWEEGEFFLPELVTAAAAMKAGMAVAQPHLGAGEGLPGRGRVVIGTVEGDIHDIGKSLVATLLQAAGFSVVDEGTSVSVARFVASARSLDADLVCASALLTTTMTRQRDLVAAVRQAGLRARVMVGGAPVTAEWVAAIGADGWADNAVGAVHAARKLVVSAERG
jgi:5-methyltetrahydrofolate--homocysteine methyltransferase